MNSPNDFPLYYEEIENGDMQKLGDLKTEFSARQIKLHDKRRNRGLEFTQDELLYSDHLALLIKRINHKIWEIFDHNTP